jgi:enamine deaminase RidA (YjgF/YER057c/UK114 family)
MNKLISAAAVAAGLALATSASAQIMHINPSKAFIAKAVTVPGGSDMIYVSGITPQPADKAKPSELGDTRAQTISILGQIEGILKDQGYTLSDVAMMRVYLVGDPAKGGKMDFAGMMEGYNSFFGRPGEQARPRDQAGRRPGRPHHAGRDRGPGRQGPRRRKQPRSSS